MQHSYNGAVLASTGGAGRGRRVPGPSPALFLTSYTNSPASTPTAEPKGPGGRGDCGWGTLAGCWRCFRQAAKRPLYDTPTGGRDLV